VERKAFAEYIERRVKELKITKTALAKRAGISRSELYKLLGQDIDEARLSTIARLARALDVNIFRLIKQITSLSARNMAPIVIPQHAEDAMGVICRPNFSDCRIVGVGEEFEYIWRVCNLGSIPWKDRQLVCLDGDIIAVNTCDLTGPPLLARQLAPVSDKVVVPDTLPGGIAEIPVRFKAPAHPCTATSYWKLANRDGTSCFPGVEELVCKIHVVDRCR